MKGVRARAARATSGVPLIAEIAIQIDTEAIATDGFTILTPHAILRVDMTSIFRSRTAALRTRA